MFSNDLFMRHKNITGVELILPLLYLQYHTLGTNDTINYKVK